MGGASDGVKSVGGDSVRSSGEAVRSVGTEGASKPKKAKGFRKGKSDKKNRDSSTNVR